MTDTPTLAAQPRRALLRMLPWALLLAPFLLLALWLQFGSREACAPQLLGVPQVYWALLGATRGLPLLILIFTLAQLPTALKVLRDGYFPPLDAVCLRPTLARRGPMIRLLRGYPMLIAPVLALGLVLLGHQAHEEVMHGRSIDDLQRALEADCHHP
ncbi:MULTISPECIES: hypothetical protein [unclassified Pseudomonas]|uniref:hypothetical protein n=1 Tax=unclassified Pseudomonas TaxID=196821 RepID=UPI0024473F7A|nr:MULTISPECIES: hypothetical protein [unclassified Pseudomonas]MDH0895815.1 hypothetical protein [Pseudomonas sp. GD03875]MDH1064889.1 hypothetical protein [Pseudomonas sp. GD03985]